MESRNPLGKGGWCPFLKEWRSLWESASQWQGCRPWYWCLRLPVGHRNCHTYTGRWLFRWGRQNRGQSLLVQRTAMIILWKFYGPVLPICRRTFADVDCHIKHSALYASHELALCERWCLKMQSSHHTVERHTLIVLNKLYGLSKIGERNLFIKFSLWERLKK